MKTLSVLLFLVVFSTQFADARMGGGRSSMGSRGSRSVAPRSNNYQRPQQAQQQPYGQQNQMPPSYAPRSNPFFSGLAGGLAGGFLGSLLFRGTPAYGAGGAGGGGIGFLEIILLAIAGFFIFRWFKNKNSQPPTRYTVNPQGSSFQNETAGPSSFAETSQISDLLARYDGGDIEQFKEKRTDDFFKIQAGFMNRDANNLKSQLTSDLFEAVNQDLERMKAEHKINKLENISVRTADVVEAWEEPNRLYATVKYQANVLDYVVNDQTGEVVEGNKTNPVKFEEYWTFCADISNSTQNPQWKLSAIEGTA